MIQPGDSVGSDRRAKFTLGQVFATGPILNALTQDELFAALQKHALCDWGEVSKEDWAANDRGLVEGTRLLSAYRVRDGRKFWVITEADRASTVVVFPEEY